MSSIFTIGSSPKKSKKPLNYFKKILLFCATINNQTFMTARKEKIKLFILLSQAIGLLVTLLCSLIGALYIFDGEWLYAFPISMIFVVSMYYLVVFFCKEKENRRKKGYPPVFYYLFGVYAIMSIVLSFFVLHFLHEVLNYTPLFVFQ